MNISIDDISQTLLHNRVWLVKNLLLMLGLLITYWTIKKSAADKGATPAIVAN